MKTKKTRIRRLLQADLSIQISIIVLTLLQLIIPNTGWSSFVTFYFGLGGFQLLSYIFHFSRRIKKGELSETYTYTLIGIIVFGALSLLSNQALIVFMIIMLFTGIFMALYYLNHTYNNLKMYQYEK